MAALVFRDARAEATAQLPPSHEARVLEPSPPANTDPNWFADDPTAPGTLSSTLVTPISNEGIRWETMVESGVSADYVASHWLGCYRRLQQIPRGYETTLRSLHQLAYFVLAPARHRSNGKIGLRYTYRGFGTPFFGDDEQIRIEEERLVRQTQREASDWPLSTIAEACRQVELPYRPVWFAFRDLLEPVAPTARLQLDQPAVDTVTDWFGFGTSVLEQLRRLPGAIDVSRVQLWPEHFDLAIEMGPEKARASYGASPGDDSHPEPYLYVSAWGTIDRADSFWNDRAFNGASLSYRKLLDAEDQRAAALDFFAQGFRILNPAPG